MSQRKTQLGNDPVRRKIEALGSKLSLPTVKRALGALEGDHPSRRRGNGYDFLDLRPYTIGDEARLIDWKASARSGRPMVTDKEHNSTSKIWMLLDAGIEMSSTTVSGERQIDVALNALRMFATLSLRRSDEVSLVIGDAKRISRIPVDGGYLAFDNTLERFARRGFKAHRDLSAILDYARRIQDRYAMIVIATDDNAWNDENIKALGLLAQTHPMVIVSVNSINPFDTSTKFDHIVNATSSQRIPAFLRTQKVSDSVKVHREFVTKSLEQKVHQLNATMIRAGSSQAMFDEFVHQVSLSLHGTPSGYRGRIAPERSTRTA